MSLSYASKKSFSLEFHNVLSLSSFLMEENDVLSIEEFAEYTSESYNIIFPKRDIDPKRLMKELPAYYMVYLAKNWLEKCSSPQYPKRDVPANKSSERPYLRLVR